MKHSHCKQVLSVILLLDRSISFMCVFCVSSFSSPLFDLNPPNFSLGFQDVITIDMLREAYPLLDVVDHDRRPKGSVSTINVGASLCSVTDE